MTLAALITLAAVLGVLLTLAFTRLPADAVLMAAVTVLIVTGVLSPGEAVAGFSNTGLMTVAALYVVAAGLRETGAIQWVAQGMLGQPQGARRAQARLFAPTAILSAFLNNTAVVAMFIPAVQEWARKLNIAPSKLLIPLSYAAILGGTCTLIGTSTNLVVNGLMEAGGYQGFHLFSLAWVGLPLALAGGLFLFLFAERLLPNRGGVAEQLEQVRKYSVEVAVEESGPLVGKSIADAGLRNLGYGYLHEIIRGAHILAAVGPNTRLEAGDRLMFVGTPDCAMELRSIQGLRPAQAGVHKLAIENHERRLVEAVISPDFPGLGKTIKEMEFRTRYRAAILSVYRAGEAAQGKLGDIRLRVGDTLLMETNAAFVDQYRARRDFLLVSAINDSTPPDFRRARRALLVLVAMVGLAGFGVLSMLEAAFVAAGAMLASKCVTVSRARNGVDFSVLIVIGASFALGAAMTGTGLADQIAAWLTSGMTSPLLALLVVYLLTAAFTEMITNNGAAVIMFSIAIAVAGQVGADPTPFVVAVMFAASAAFITPIGYQTNLMVMGPGGYRFSDYIRVGVPFSLLACVICVSLIPLVWPFTG